MTQIYCKAITRSGRKCLNPSIIGEYCSWHIPISGKSERNPLLRRKQKLITHYKARISILEAEIVEIKKK